MGLPWSIEKILGWRTRYEAVLRRKARLERCYRDELADPSDAEDYFLAFCVFCYHLRDFVVETGGVPAYELDKLVQSNRAMQLCRDVCNRVKHHTISRTSVDADWSLGREYTELPDGRPGSRQFLIAGGEQYRPMEIVHQCVHFWAQLVDSGKLSEPRNPFARP